MDYKKNELDEMKKLFVWEKQSERETNPRERGRNRKQKPLRSTLSSLTDLSSISAACLYETTIKSLTSSDVTYNNVLHSMVYAKEKVVFMGVLKSFTFNSVGSLYNF